MLNLVIRASQPKRGGGAKSARTRRRVLEAAIDCLVARGLRGTNIGRVAEVAGLSRGAVQYYFKRTDDLLPALAVHLAKAPGAPPDERLAIVRMELATAARTVPALNALSPGPAGKPKPRLRVIAPSRPAG